MTKSKGKYKLKIKAPDRTIRCQSCGIRLNSPDLPGCETEATVFRGRLICAYCQRIWKKDESKWAHREVSWLEFTTRSTSLITEILKVRNFASVISSTDDDSIDYLPWMKHSRRGHINSR